MSMRSDRKKLLLVLVGILPIGFIGTLYLHRQEQEAWFNWRQSQFNIIDEITKKQKENNWTNAEADSYSKMLKDSLGEEPPAHCPYCYVKHLIK